MRKMTEDFIGTCQWCLGEYKVNADRKVVLHGYQRPGYGYTVGNCQGYTYEPLQYSCERTKERLAQLEQELAKVTKQIKMIDDGKVTKVPNRYYVSPEVKAERARSGHRYSTSADDDLQFFDSSHRMFAQTLRIMRANLVSEEKFTKDLVDHFAFVIDGWKLGTIIGLDSPPTGRERYVRDAYDPTVEKQRAEQAVAKAARDSKPGKITINIYGEVFFPDRNRFQASMAGADEEWRAGIERHYAEEKAFKERIKAWAKATFPGKVWVGEGDKYEIRRIGLTDRPSLPSGTDTVCIAIKPEWQYLDQVMAMFPNAYRYDKDTSRRDPVTNHGIGKGKDIRLWVDVSKLPA